MFIILNVIDGPIASDKGNKLYEMSAPSDVNHVNVIFQN